MHGYQRPWCRNNSHTAGNLWWIDLLTPGIGTHKPFCVGRTEQHYHESPSLKNHDSNYSWSHVTVLIFMIFMSEYPWETIAFSLDHMQWVMSQFSITSPMFKEDWPHWPHSEYGSAMETLSCPTWDKTWQSYWQTCTPTADTTLLTLDSQDGTGI